MKNYDLPLTQGWMFHYGEAKRFAGKTHGDIYNACKAGGRLGNADTFLTENDWQAVTLPHDWCAALPYDPDAPSSNGHKVRGCGWYHNRFTLPEAPIENANLVFEGVLGETTVYVNGVIAGRNFSGYNRFSCDVSPYLNPGAENLIALCVDASFPEGWSYEGAGLYRPVRIELRGETFLDGYGSFLRSEMHEGAWSAAADIRISGPTDGFTLLSRLEAPNGKVISETEQPAESLTRISVPVENPMLWSPESPVLYRYTCTLMKDGVPADTWSTSIGFRSVEWEKDSGMHLNGTKYLIKGICCHQDHGGVGAAVTPELMEYRISRLKEYGINAYRCAHHAMPDAFLEVCDRLGMLVMVENRHFSASEDTLRELDAMVKVSRSHPSVFLYSLFNEEPWQAEERGYRMAKIMRERIRRLDPTRAVTGAMNGGVSALRNAADAMDVVGINYYNECYGEYHARTPDKALLGTENCPTFATRGEYKTDNAAQVYDSYGDFWADFTMSMQDTMKSLEENPFCAGVFAWSGLDSYGEPQPHAWPSITCHWGIMDICGFAKDTARLLEAWYTDDLCVHLMPHWNWKAGETVRVCAFTNGDTAELFLNGESLGERTVTERRADWYVPFTPGTLRVTVRRGDKILSDEVKTVGAPAKLVLEDVTPKRENALYRIVNISAADENGSIVPDFGGTVTFDAAGAKVCGVANGNPNGTQPLIAQSIPLFHGRAQLIAAADGKPVLAACEGLPDASV